MRQTDCNGILRCSDPVLHTPAWSGDHYDRGFAQRLESEHPCGPNLLPRSGGTDVDARCSHRRGGRDP